MFLTTSALLTGCQAPSKPDAKASAFESTLSVDQLPPILSLFTHKGRGVPYGRSDSAETYLQAGLPASNNPKYAFTSDTPVRIQRRGSELRHIQYLNSLRGPNGEPIDYERRGACCPFEINHSPMGGLLDIYRLRIDGASRDIFIFVDMYSADDVRIPLGLTQRK